MQSGASRADLLAARDARHALLVRHSGAGHAALVAVALNVPGEVKTPPGGGALFRWALAELAAALPGAAPLHVSEDALGPFAVLAVPGDAAATKAACVAIEASRPRARLVDLDVSAPGGAPVDRAALGLPPRPCLLCPSPAVECSRLARHPIAAVVARARELLADAAA
jgi:holo-ACP synthase